MKIDYQIDMKSFEQQMGVWKDDLRYVTSRAINDTLIDSQKTMVSSINDHFTIRRPHFVKNSVKISKFSNKTDLTGVVGIENIGGKDTANILAKFEQGGDKRSHTGGKVAVPTQYIRPNPNRIVPSSKRPRVLANAVKVTTKTGAELLIVKRGKGRSRTSEIAYVLKNSVPIDNRLRFVDTVTRQINDSYQRHFNTRFAEVRMKSLR